ncbi:MAG TPA: alpha/beta hydrolase [Arenibacter sp.]|nr:alpha/beta hydrolase [Arenibacter sp.]
MNKIIYRTLALSYGAYFNTLAHFSQELAAKKAFQLFSTPRKGRVLPHQEQFLKNALDEMVPIKGSGVQTYHWPGPKETVLLLHGWESNVFRWRKLIERLRAEGFNIIAFDAPGHGYSQGNKLNLANYSESAQQLIGMHNPKYIIGHSMGGLTMLHDQHKNPDSSIEKIVALGAPAELSELLEHYQQLLMFDNRILKGLDDYFYEQYDCRIKDISTPTYAQKISKPGLIVHDELDPITPFSASVRLHEKWKNSQLIKTSGLGHSLHQEEVNNKIVDFLKS